MANLFGASWSTIIVLLQEVKESTIDKKNMSIAGNKWTCVIIAWHWPIFAWLKTWDTPNWFIFSFGLDISCINVNICLEDVTQSNFCAGLHTECSNIYLKWRYRICRPNWRFPVPDFRRRKLVLVDLLGWPARRNWNRIWLLLI